MRRVVPSFLFLILAASVASACGDKFLVTGNSHRYIQPRTAGSFRPAYVVIFTNKTAGARPAVTDKELRRTLEDVGHTVKLVDDVKALEKELGSKKYEVVLADITDSETVQLALKNTGANANLLPVMYNPSFVDAAAAKSEYKCVLKMPAHPDNILSVIQDSLAQRK